MATVDFNSADAVTTAPAHRVYTRAAWGDSWTLRADIACVQCTWNAAPDRSSAVIVRDYGRVIQPGGIATADLTPLSLDGAFVLIEWDTDETVLTVPVINYWLGVIDGKADAPDGPTDGTNPASGRQSFTCFGMERLLQVAPIIDTVWKDDTASARSGGATAFNAGGVPNRSADVITDETYVFEPDPTAAEFWSTRDIIKHLLFYHLPTNSGGVASIPWTLANDSIVPDWDAPEIETEGQTVWNVINRLLDSRLLLGWGVGFDNTDLLVAPFSISASSVTLADKTFAANATQHAISYSTDPLTEAEITVDRTDMVDQLVVRGARRVSVCTFQNLTNGWTQGDPSQEDDYNTGASGEVGYSGYDLVRKREANDAARNVDELADVFSLLVVPDSWDYTVPNGLSTENVFPPLSGTDPHTPYRAAVRALPMLPLRKGIDYSGDLSLVDEMAVGDYRKPYAIIEIRNDGFTDIEQIGVSIKMVPATREVIDYTISCDAEPDRLAVRLIVHGGPQHVIGSTDFVSLPDDDIFTAPFDWDTVAVTLAVTDDRYCEATEPASVSTTDIVRRRVFHVGDAYQQVYIVPGTIIGIDATNTVITATGGYLRDDSQKLTYLAKLLAAYHTSPRTSLTLRTHRRTSLMSVGDMVATANGTNIGAVITRIQIDAPLGDGRTEPIATQTFISSSVELDLLSTLAVASRA